MNSRIPSSDITRTYTPHNRLTQDAKISEPLHRALSVSLIAAVGLLFYWLFIPLALLLAYGNKGRNRRVNAAGEFTYIAGGAALCALLLVYYFNFDTGLGCAMDMTSLIGAGYLLAYPLIRGTYCIYCMVRDHIHR